MNFKVLLMIFILKSHTGTPIASRIIRDFFLCVAHAEGVKRRGRISRLISPDNIIGYTPRFPQHVVLS